MLIGLGSLIVSCQNSLKVRSLLLKKSLDDQLIIVESYECNEPKLVVDGKIKLKEDESASIKWVYTPSETIIYEAPILLEKDNYFRSSIHNGEYLWPLGIYRTEIYVNDEMIKELEFDVTQVSKEKNE